MPNFKSLIEILAVGTALTGGALVLGAAGATAASASVVMGGVPAPAPAPAPAVVSRPVCHKTVCFRQERQHNRNHNWNHNREWQHARQHEHQRQFLMRDFTLLVSPFQKDDTQATPWQKQDTDRKFASESE